MSQDWLMGFITALALVTIVATIYTLYDSWVEYSDSMRVAKWFEDNEMGER